MDKKYIADKRAKSNRYKNPKYNKKTESVEKNIVSSDHKTNNKRVTDDHQQQQIEEVVPPNNWSRYEITNDDENYVSQGADYETLLLAPVSVDSHFKFKSEQNWDEDIKSQIDLSKYFTLNIALLNDGISCVPFIKRHGYEESIVSPLELELMKSTSIANLKKYNKLLERKFPPKGDIIITKNITPQISKDISEKSADQKKNEEIISEIKKEEIIPEIKKEQIIPEIKKEKKVINESHIIEDDVDDLLNLKCADLTVNDEPDIKAEDPLLEKIEIGKSIGTQPTVDLEQWLDDILDD